VILKKIEPDTINLEDCKSNVLKCYKYFTNELANRPINDRVALFNYLMDVKNEFLIVISLYDGESEQSIFDTINSAGVRLSSADIIKNALFERALDLYDNQEGDVVALYKEYWEEVFACDDEVTDFWATERTSGRLKRDNIEFLLYSIAVIEGFFDPTDKNRTLADLSNVYKDYIKGPTVDKSRLTEFIKKIAEYAKLYKKHLPVVEKNEIFSFDDYEKRLLHILSVCEVTTFHPYILFLYKNYANDEAFLKPALQKLEILVTRRFICGKDTKSYSTYCKDFIHASSRLDAILAETSDDEFRKRLETIENKPATLLLFWVELYRRNINSNHDIDSLQYTYTLEHLMPREWERYWANVPIIGDDGNAIRDSEEKKMYREKHIYNIGNMTLLKGKLNTSLRNYDFKRKISGEGPKRHGIKDLSDLLITKVDIVKPFMDGDIVWDEMKIRKRCKQIADDVLKIWPNTPNTN
jgi:hypothetical protein